MKNAKLYSSICLLLLLVGPAAAETAPEFIISSSKLISTKNPKTFIMLGETAPFPVLKSRFPGFKIDPTPGADCIVCGTISNKTTEIFIDFDDSGLKVSSVTVYKGNVADPLDNRIGMKMRDAVGRTGHCDSGMDDITCSSSSLLGLSYIAGGKNCDFQPTPPTETDKSPASDIPACTTIDGFSIYAPDQPN